MERTPTRFEALKLVVEAYGSQEATAGAFGVCQSTISRWLNQSKQLPAQYVLRAEEDTGVSRHWTRPDIYPVEHARLQPRFNGVDQRVTRVSFQHEPILKAGVA